MRAVVGNVGLFRIPPEQVESIAVCALRSGYQMATHAIGDRANRVALDLYASALQQVPTVNHRFRIEHAQLLTAQDVPRFAELGVIPSMQGSHQTSDMSWVVSRIGPVRVSCRRSSIQVVEAGDKSSPRCSLASARVIPAGAAPSPGSAR